MTKKTQRPARPERKAPSAPAEAPPVEPIEPDIGAEDGVFRSGYVALIGRPNVGKSTLLNALLGQKLAATTHKPQTTRKNLLGVLNPKGAQILLLDTPGYHRAKGPLNRYMVSQAEQAIEEADVIGYVLEARDNERITPGNERIVEILAKSGKRIVLLLNKVDRLKNKEGMLFQIRALEAALADQIAAVVPIAATKRKGLDRAVIELGRALPPGPKYFEDDTVTDQSERSIVAELIREKVMLETQDELPYAAAVTIDLFEDERPRLVRVMATVHVERSSQKAIVIGRQGERIKSIGIRARQEMEKFVGSKVYLELHVRVTGDWSNSRRVMAELGYADEKQDGMRFEIPEDLQADLP